MIGVYTSFFCCRSSFSCCSFLISLSLYILSFLGLSCGILSQELAHTLQLEIVDLWHSWCKHKGQQIVEGWLVNPVHQSGICPTSWCRLVAYTIASRAMHAGVPGHMVRGVRVVWLMDWCWKTLPFQNLWPWLCFPHQSGEYLTIMRQFQQECGFFECNKAPQHCAVLGSYHNPETRLPMLLMKLMDES